MKKKSAVTAPWEVTEEMFLTEDEVAALQVCLRQCEESADVGTKVSATVDRLIVEILLFSGLRNSELCRLRAVDTIVGHGESALKVTGTPKQDRTVYVPQSISDLITRFVADVRPRLSTRRRQCT